MSSAPRISPLEFHHKRRQGESTMLVGAYNSDEKFQNHRLEGAISLSALKDQLDHLDKNQEIVFYCG